MILVVVIVYRLKKQRDTQANPAATDLALDVDMVYLTPISPRTCGRFRYA